VFTVRRKRTFIHRLLLHKHLNLLDSAHAHSQNILTFSVRILLMLAILAVPAHDALGRDTLPSSLHIFAPPQCFYHMCGVSRITVTSIHPSNANRGLFLCGRPSRSIPFFWDIMLKLFPIQHKPVGFYNRDGVSTARYGLNLHNSGQTQSPHSTPKRPLPTALLYLQPVATTRTSGYNVRTFTAVNAPPSKNNKCCACHYLPHRLLSLPPSLLLPPI